MKQKLTGLGYFRAVIAKWLVVNVAARISPLAVMSLCVETANLYYQSIEVAEDPDDE